MATLLSVFKTKKRVQNDPYTRKSNGATGIKIGMQIQLDSVNNKGCVPSGHTTSSVCKTKTPKMVLPKKTA